MGNPIWIDQTLNTAVRWQFTSSQLAELADLLARLGIKQADVCLDDWHWYRPDLATVQNCLALRGITGIAGTGLKLARQAGLTEVAVALRVAGAGKLDVALEDVMNQASQLGLQAALLMEDLLGCSAADIEAVAAVVNKFDFTAVICDDGRGLGDPFAVCKQMDFFQRKFKCPVELRAGNAYGMATANTLAAMKAGVWRLATAVAGVGGCTPWEEALLVARQLGGMNIEFPRDLAGKCQQVLNMLGLNMPENKAVIGPEIFAHESGLHVDGVNKAPEIYEPYDPELVGLKRQLVIGKHSGSAALRTKFAAWGICLEEAETKRLLGDVRALAVSKKAAVTDEELQQLYRSG
ncbi:hypothetical protein [Sporomusa aerivorans]|uniref:homocitrate synthase/isopropylmalate synthase family protein n=1 Tax=Sporomusa aerivorans TaxID=204936 RepID=UPI00352B75BE